MSVNRNITTETLETKSINTNQYCSGWTCTSVFSWCSVTKLFILLTVSYIILFLSYILSSSFLSLMGNHHIQYKTPIINI